MMKRWALVCVAAPAIGCASTDSFATGENGSNGPGGCAAEASSYKVHLTETSGNCGPQSDGVVNSDERQPGCTGSRKLNGCDILLTDYACMSADGLTLTQTGQIKWRSDGASASGTIAVTVSRGSTRLCESVYDVTYTRM